MEEEALKRLLIKAGAYAAKAEHSPMEVRRKLQAWSDGEISDKETEELIEALQADRFIDVQRYVERYLSEKIRLLQKGPHLLRQELREKGITEQYIEEGIKEIPRQDWVVALTRYLEARLDRQKERAKNSYDLRHRLYQLGFGRGFDSDLIEEVVEDLDLTLAHEAEEDDYYW